MKQPPYYSYYTLFLTLVNELFIISSCSFTVHPSSIIFSHNPSPIQFRVTRISEFKGQMRVAVSPPDVIGQV